VTSSLIIYESSLDYFICNILFVTLSFNIFPLFSSQNVLPCAILACLLNV
jgi:hypothetical protein